MEVFLDFVKRMTCYLIVVTVASTLLLEVFDYERYILGWVWGCAINLLYLLILGLWGYKLRHKELRTIEKATKLGTLIRITLVAIGTLLAVYLFENFPFVPYMLGLMLWRPLMIYERIRYNQADSPNVI